MRTFVRLSSLILICCLGAACSDRAATPPQSQHEEPSTSTPADAPTDANARRAKLTASGIPSQYAAHFDGKQLVTIDEQRSPAGGATLNGEYTFEGARLMRYRGAKVATPAELDLQFDLRGGLESGRGPDVTDEDVDAIRTRAQLLRSHALAHRDINAH